MGQSTIESRVSRLSPRQIECLRLVAENHSSKEIARLLNLSVHTVNSYIAESIEILGAHSRRDAARRVASHAPISTPNLVGSESFRVMPSSSNGQSSVGTSGVSTSEVLDQYGAASFNRIGGKVFSGRFHLFRAGQEHNSLSRTERLIWIFFVAVGLSVLFATAVVVIDSMARLAGR
jgi:DNA-binding CsgD family transcriptional regulator